MNRDHTPQPDIQTCDAVRFIHLRVTIYPAVDYVCRGPWMCAAADGLGFRLRTEQTELILAPVLNANIYVIVTGPLVNIVVNGLLIIDSEKCRRRFCILCSRDIGLLRDTGLNDVVVHGVLCKIINA